MENRFTDEQFLARWLAGELSPEEEQDFASQGDYPLYERIRLATQQLKAPAFDQEESLQQLKEQLPDKETPVVSMSSRKNRRWMYAAAASLLFVAGIWAWIQANDPLPKQIITEIGAQMPVQLPDGSEITLNAGSELNYFGKKRVFQQERKVSLTGEAFLKVTSGKGFQVATESGTVEVLGTQFNVNAREDRLEVHCFEGVVHVRSDAISDTLNPGEAIRIKHGALVRSWNMERVEQPGWLDGVSHFDQVPLEEVLEALERQYGIEIAPFEGITGKRFTGDFVHDDLGTALKMVCEPFSIKFTQQGTMVYLE